MSKFFILLVGVLISTSILAGNAMPKVSFQDAPIHSYTLANGLKILVKEDHRAPVVISEVWYKVGSGYEHNGITGISHMLEHMMLQGTPTYPKEVFNQLVDKNGGEDNAMTNWDYSFYYEKFSSDKLPLSFKLEADRMRHLAFNKKDFEKEKKVVLNELRLRILNVPQSIALVRYNNIGFVGSPYSHPVLGWLSDVQNISLDDVKQWYQTWYAPNNATVVVVGDVKPEQVYSLAKQYFGPLHAQKIPTVKSHSIIKAYGPRQVTVNLPSKLPLIFMGFNVPSLVTEPNSWEPYALLVAKAILGGDSSARMNNELMRKQGLASSITLDYDLYTRLPGMFNIAAVPTQQHTTAELEQAILKQIKQLQKGPISAEELSRVKTSLFASKVYDSDSISAQAFSLGTLASIGLPWTVKDEFYQKIQQVTAQQVQAVVKKYLQPNVVVISVLNPKSLNKSKHHKDS